jgi:hypothetical protein
MIKISMNDETLEIIRVMINIKNLYKIKFCKNLLQTQSCIGLKIVSFVYAAVSLLLFIKLCLFPYAK